MKNLTTTFLFVLFLCINLTAQLQELLADGISYGDDFGESIAIDGNYF